MSDLDRTVVPDERHAAGIAGTILFLASDLARFVTGQTLVGDGGVAAKFPSPDF
jgi:NAD(P)-dependent dehydrogenase (short-subunit alcohol dehydrogenase family)